MLTDNDTIGLLKSVLLCVVREVTSPNVTNDTTVYLESINKGNCVSHIYYLVAPQLTGRAGRASRVDVKKLEKQEAKLKAKIEKRSRKDLYKGFCSNRRRSRFDYTLLHVSLIDDVRFEQSYEEML